jgi:hypothetical protein
MTACRAKAPLRRNPAARGAAGSGSAKVWAVDSLKAQIAGSGDVAYWGDPATRGSVVGAGRLRRLGAAPR